VALWEEPTFINLDDLPEGKGIDLVDDGMNENPRFVLFVLGF